MPDGRSSTYVAQKIPPELLQMELEDKLWSGSSARFWRSVAKATEEGEAVKRGEKQSGEVWDWMNQELNIGSLTGGYSYAALGGLLGKSLSRSAVRGIASKAAEQIPIRAYHGSGAPKFEKFDMAKVGTGEGSHAFGHGLYFTESPSIAKYYRNSLAKQGQVMIAGESVNDILEKIYANSDTIIPSWWFSGGATSYVRALDALQEVQVSFNARGIPDLTPNQILDDAISRLHKRREDAIRASERDIVNADYTEEVELGEAIEELDRIKEQGTLSYKYNPGSFYQVDLHVQPEELLDWDAPYEKQPDAVRGAWHRLAGDKAMKGWYERYTGGDMYAMLMNVLGEKEVSTKLREEGVKGVQYFSGPARKAQSGKRNFVMFDEKSVEILRALSLAAALRGVTDLQQQKNLTQQP